jgi:putative DNA primase/helicase
MLWILDEPDDEVYCDLWRSLTDEERSAIGARGFERFRKLTPYVERAQRVPKPDTKTIAILDSTSDVLIDVTQDNVALIFVERHAQAFRFSHDRGSWHAWDGTRWRMETTRLAFDYARRLTRTLNTAGNREVAKASFCEGVEKFARADRAFALRGDEWNCDPWLLNTPGGTVDLRTGTMRQHDPRDLITKITTVSPENGTPEVWLNFLKQATKGDETLIAFLRRVAGYALTADTREECLFYLYGPGGNGKGTFVGAVFNIMGEYAANAAMDVFLASRHERHSTDLAMLRGARMVTASEAAEGRMWDEQKVKALTGNDPVTCRFMRQDNFTYLPTFKLVLLGNNKPLLRTVDDAWRRRFHIIPFTFTPPQKDLSLKARLMTEYPRILNWAIEGCTDWQANGLQVPQRVADETAEYFAAQDIFGEWLEACCELSPSYQDKSAKLFPSWKDFAERAGDNAGSGKAFADRLQQRGFQRVHHLPLIGGRGFKGLRLREAQK